MIKQEKKTLTRREFIASLGATTALAFVSFGKAGVLLANPANKINNYTAKVAVTEADNYERVFIRQKVESLFDALGGLGDVVSTSAKVAIKINLTGGSGIQQHPRLNGADVRNTVWTHPEVLRAVCELLIDSNVQPQNIFIVEALWDQASFTDFGYQEVMNDVGAQFIDLNQPAPYSDFVNISTGVNQFYYDSFVMNQILQDVDCYVSIPKMKHHYSAGATHSIKNQIGAVPLSMYNNNGQDSHRARLHNEGGDPNIHLPNAIADLFLARPVNLAVNDGIKNSINAEGPWVPGYENAEYGLLLASKDPIALDSISTYQMGGNPEGDQLELPDGNTSNNYLKMLADLGYGTNIISEIELVGDGAGAIVSVEDDGKSNMPDEIVLFQNYPNPFNPKTTIKFSLSKASSVNLAVYNMLGKKVHTLMDKDLSAGSYEVLWDSRDKSGNVVPTGIYFYRLESTSGIKTRKMILMK